MTTMNAVWISRFGWPEVLEVRQVGTCVVVIGFGMHVQHFSYAVETRERFRDLCAYGR